MDDPVAATDSANDAIGDRPLQSTKVFDGDLSKLDKKTRRELFRQNIYPYSTKLGRADYEAFKYELQIELLKMQSWVRDTGERVLILFEGRDAAGKGGTIKRIMEHLNPRGARIVALEKPSTREAGQWYFQRYIQHLPSAGEIVLFDRSWYNRAGVERVMGFCSGSEYLEFMRQTPELERMLVRSGIRLFKLWFSVSRGEQLRRFKSREHDPLKQWKLSPIDLGVTGQVGRLHQGQGGDVLPHRYRRCALDRDQVRRQEARAHQRDTARAARHPVRQQGR
jgi:polyphosphate kinase 2